MEKLYVFSIFFLIIPLAFADITIQTNQHLYNLGNKIQASASVLHDKDFEGLLRFEISCGNYRLEYFLTPISLEANFRTAVGVPEMTATQPMLGSCKVIADLMTNDKLVIDEQGSNSFEITNQLKVLPVKSKITALPSELIQIVGIVNEANGNNVLKADAKAKLGNDEHKIEAIDGKFNLTLEVPNNIKSGKHTIDISASDAKNNFGEGFIELEITAVPNNLKLEVSDIIVKPGSEIAIIAYLYDQANDFINDTAILELLSLNEKKIFTKAIQSNKKISYELSQYAEPGIYTLIGTYKNLKSQSSINITAIREVKVKYYNQDVSIENIGNIPFQDELTFIVQNQLRKYLVTKKINIEPGKILSIDLSKEVPQGVYNVLLSAKEGISSVKEAINQTFGSAGRENLLANDVLINDNRPLYKRIGSGISSISALLVGANGLLTRNPILAPTILVVILLLIILRYGRKPLVKMFKREKKESKEEKET